MRAAVLTEINTTLQILDLEQDRRTRRSPGWVKAAGVCMSDPHIIDGDWPLRLPMVLGHEAAGSSRMRSGVAGLTPGDHVIFSFRPHCGIAAIARRGRRCCASATTTWRAR